MTKKTTTEKTPITSPELVEFSKTGKLTNIQREIFENSVVLRQENSRVIQARFAKVIGFSFLYIALLGYAMEEAYIGNTALGIAIIAGLLRV